MNKLINKKVRHKMWGTGVITDAEDKSVTIEFGGEKKKFVYPDAFKSFLTFTEESLQAEADALIKEKHEEKARIREAEERERRVAEKKQMIERVRRAKEKKTGRKEIRHENPAFKCGTESSCAVFNDWIIRAGKDSKGKPRRFKNIEANRLAILTIAGSGLSEENRIIFGVFLIDETFEGNDYREGFVKSSPKYRISLKSEESQKMRFWDYYRNESGLKKWGTGMFRDIDNKTAARLLRDIVELKSGTDDETAARELYDYFYRIHKYTIEG